MKQLLTSICLVCFTCLSYAQDMVVFQSNMRSKAANQFYEEEYRNIGTYKVKGNSYLIKGNNVSDIFTTLGYGVNMPLVYDIYSQEVAVLQPDRASIVTLSLDEIDSFYVKIDSGHKVKGPAMFRNMTKIDAGSKNYMQELVNGSKYKLYKYYYADMVNASTNIAQTNLKEFEVRSDFYFVDYTKDGAKQLIKIKGNLKGLKDYFKSKPEALKILNDVNKGNLEDKLVGYFETVNTI